MTDRAHDLDAARAYSESRRMAWLFLPIIRRVPWLNTAYEISLLYGKTHD